jgi:hypothetical protein
MLIDLSEEKGMNLQENEFLDGGLLLLHPHRKPGCFEEGLGFSNHPCL